MRDVHLDFSDIISFQVINYIRYIKKKIVIRPSVVRLGEVDFERVDESQAFDYEVEAIQVHEEYALPARYNDIAIITLKYEVSSQYSIFTKNKIYSILDIVYVEYGICGDI